MFNSLDESPWKKGDILKLSGNREVEVLEVNGGGMGIVLICLVKEEMTPLVLKTYKPKWSKEQKFIQRFEWEAEAWVRLGFHENIVKAFGIERIYGYIFVIAEYISGVRDIGVSLNDWIGKKQLNINKVPQILNFAWQFCMGMVYANKIFDEELKISFVHKDIKPSNILINTNEVIKITDFGLVKAYNEVEEVCGTPPYIAPEIWLKQEADEMSDLYSFGCTLYEMIKAKPPFVTFSKEDYRDRHLYQQPELNGIPDDLREVVAQCLEKDREKRRKFCNGFDELGERINDLYYKQTGRKLEIPQVKPAMSVEYHSKAMGLLGLGYYKEAIQYFNKTLESSDNKEFSRRELSYTYRGRGGAHLQLQNYREAVEDCTSAINLNPEDPVNYNNRGAIYSLIGKFNEALEDYNKAKSLDPFYADVYVNISRILHLKGKSYEAIENLCKALDLSPTKPEYAYNNFGAIYTDQKEFKRALEYLNRAIEINSKYAEPYFSIALIHIYEGRIEEGKEALKTFLNLSPIHYKDQIEQAKQILDLLEMKPRKDELGKFDYVLLGKEEICKPITNGLFSKGYSVLVIPPGQIEIKDKGNCLTWIKTVDKAIVVLGPEGMPQDKEIIEALMEVKSKGKPSIFIPYSSTMSSGGILQEILKIAK
jgi:serine/threonine-protein kinase